MILLSWLFLAVAPAWAETYSLETIEVRGTKESATYLETSGSVAIVPETQLPATGRENNLQAINSVPNVEVNRNGESVSIRGINSTGVTGFQKDNLSSVVIDDLFQTDLATQASSFDLWDMERLEVLRGAQSTTQGVNSLAGTILLDHRRPQPAWEGAAKLGLGSYWHREAAAVINPVFVRDRLSARISYGKELNNGWITNRATSNDRWARWDRDRARLSLLYTPNDRDSLELRFAYHRNTQGGTYTQGGDAFAGEVSEDQDFKTTTGNSQLLARYRTEWRPWFKGELVAGASFSGQDSSSDADGTVASTAGTRVERHGDRFFSVEGRLHYHGTRAKNLLGLHTHDFKLDDAYDFNLLFPVAAGVSTPLAVAQGVTRTRRTYAIFDSFQYRVADHHRLIAGLRGEVVRSRYGTQVLGQRVNNLGAAVNAQIDTYVGQISGAYEGTNSSFVVLPKLGYGWDLDGHSAALTVTRGYRTAGVSINRRRATAVEYEPEYTYNYEASYKYVGRHGAGDFQLGTNLFYIDWRRQQVQVQLSGDFYDTQVQNAARSAVYGAELEAQSALGSAHRLGLGVGYADTEFKEFTTRSGDYSGKEFPFASKWTLRLAHEWKPMERLSLLAIARGLSGSYTNAENTRRADAQFYLNLNARYALSSWLIEAYANNVLGRQFRVLDGTPTSASSPYQASYHQVTAPRELGARVSYFF